VAWDIAGGGQLGRGLGRVKGFGFFGFRVHGGFVWHFFAEGLEAVEFLDGAAVLALGVGLIAQEESEAVGLPGEAVEAFGEEKVAVLRPGDLVVLVDEQGAELHVGASAAVEGLIHAVGGGAGFEAGGAEDGLLGESDALDGEDLLGIDGLVEGDGVVAEAGDFVELLEADDGEGGGGEAVFAGVLGGAGFALGGAGPGGAGGVGAVGGELLFGDRLPFQL
jgi:hypothetical protein